MQVTNAYIVMSTTSPQAWVAEFEFRGGVVRWLVTCILSETPKWTSSSLVGPCQEIAEDEQGEDTWTRVSTKRYGSPFRRQWGENREHLSPSISFSLTFIRIILPSGSPSRLLFTSLYGLVNPRGIIIARFVPFDYLGTIQSYAATSWYTQLQKILHIFFSFFFSFSFFLSFFLPPTSRK